MVFHKYDYLFAFGTIFATLDAYNIGANDVANSFATSVASRSLTLKQACLAAAVCEFAGAVLVGGRVTKTIQDGIISIDAFRDNGGKGEINPGVQLLGFMCALMASSTWLMFSTYNSWPVSTTYSIISGVAGVGIATSGVDSVKWGWNNAEGVSAIYSGFLIAPLLAGGFAATIYLLTKTLVLSRKKSTRAGLVASPVYFFGVGAILTSAIVYGGPVFGLKKDAAEHRNPLSKGKITAIVLGSAATITVWSLAFWLPYVYAKAIRHDHTVRWYHLFIGPLLWKRPAPPPPDPGDDVPTAVPRYDIVLRDFDLSSTINEGTEQMEPDNNSHHEIDGAWILPSNLWIILRYKLVPFIKRILTHGVTVDVLRLQAGDSNKEAKRLHTMHMRVTTYKNDTEHLYSFIQVMTACTASFAHGSNDVANAIGPYAVIYHVWKTSTPADDNAKVDTWILAYGGAMIVIGLATYGYNVMRVLGNRLTLHSPSRGFSMELGSAITVLLASQYAIPVSTTMCITGATLGVALCNSSSYKSFNWRQLGIIFFSWIMTIPIVAISAGCLMGFILNAPHFSG